MFLEFLKDLYQAKFEKQYELLLMNLNHPKLS